ncbi:MAG: PDZ domain-containing protein, partial [Acidimicrobiia bacterium]
SVRELIPQLITGKISRGVIGVQVSAVPQEALAEFGLKSRRGALVGSVTRGRPAQKAGIEPGDIILVCNGTAVRTRDELVATVTATKPGTTVPVKILRDKTERTVSVTVDELDLEAENSAPEERRTSAQPEEEPSQGFGITLTTLNAETARRLRLPADTQGVVVSEVEQGSPAFRAGLAAGDVITRVNRQAVRTAQEASRILAQVPSGGTAFLLVNSRGTEQFVTIRKE